MSEKLLIKQAWPLGIQRTETKEAGCTQLKLRGNPWYTSDGVEVNQGRMMTMQIMTVMDQLGYELAGSVDMSASGGEGTSDCKYRTRIAWCSRTDKRSGHMVLRLQDPVT